MCNKYIGNEDCGLGYWICESGEEPYLKQGNPNRVKNKYGESRSPI